MMTPIRFRVLAGFSCLLAVCGMASAAEPTHSFECDTPGGHFSKWNRSVSSSAIEVSGTLKVNELREDKKWSPGATVLLAGGANGNTSIGLRLFALLKVKDMFFLEMLKPGGHQDLGIGGMIPRTTEPIPFSLVLDATGKLTVKIAGTDTSVDVGAFNPKSLSLGCSTGDFEFAGITIREISP